MRCVFGLFLCCILTVASCSSDKGRECGDPNPKLTADGREVIYKRVSCEYVGWRGSRAVESYLVAYYVETHARSRISLRGAPSYHVPFDVSSDGQIIVYEQDTIRPPGNSEIYIYDRGDRSTTVVDISEVGTLLSTTPPQAPRISGDGQVVAFVVQRNGDYGVVTYERATERLEEATTEPKAASPSLSNDGRFLAYQTGGCHDCTTSAIWVLDRDTGQRVLTSVNSDGEPANAESFEPVISGDGRFVVFRSAATNLGPPPPTGLGIWPAEVYLHDRETGTTTLLSRDADSGGASGTTTFDVMALMTVTSHAITSDGQIVVYQSNAANIVPAEGPLNGPPNNVYRYDAVAGRTTRASVNSLGEPADGVQLHVSVSDDGLLVVFQADSTNLDSTDEDFNLDAYLHDVESGDTRWVNR
jgi:Tol biopolymer transport system component